MKWDDGVQDRRLSLDITPLIDVVFLLVLFFAVSTSFISADDLSVLRQDVASLTEDRESLTVEIEKRTEEVAKLQTSLLEQLETARDLNAMVVALEQRRASLRSSLDEVNREKRTLREQLEQAARDYAALDLELEGLGAERDRAAEQERLLRALLLEKEAANTDLERALAEAATTLDETRDAREQLEQRERMLQALLAEKAAEYEGLEVQLVRAEERNDTLSTRLAALRTESESHGRDAMELRTEILRLQAELGKYRAVSELDREQIEQILQAQRSLQDGLEAYLRDNRLNINRDRQRLVLQLSDQILFASGSAEINDQGIDVLSTVGDIIKSRTANLEIQIAGHTDNLPIASGSGVLATNWGLSAARAVNVVRFLEQEVGIDSRRLSAIAYGEQRPVASNTTERGRAANRRIEIVLVPR